MHLNFFFPINFLEAVMYGISDDCMNPCFGTVAVGHNGEVCQQRYCTITEHGCTRTPPHRLLPSPTPQAWEDSTIGNPCPASPRCNFPWRPVRLGVWLELVTGIFSFGNMGWAMWVGETALTCLDDHSRYLFLLNINAKKLFVYPVHSPTNTLFINLVKSFKFTLKYTIISLLHVSVFNDGHQGALSVPNYSYIYTKNTR